MRKILVTSFHLDTGVSVSCCKVNNEVWRVYLEVVNFLICRLFDFSKIAKCEYEVRQSYFNVPTLHQFQNSIKVNKLKKCTELHRVVLNPLRQFNPLQIKTTILFMQHVAKCSITKWPGCTKLHKDAPSCTKLHLVAQRGTKLHQARCAMFWFGAD